MEELKYGLLGDKLVHIDDVEKGLACNCRCPHCKGQLVAKKGEKRSRHFSHYKLANCDHGTESALHLMAKNIIAETRTVYVPLVPKNGYDFSNRGGVVTFEKAVLEKQLSDTIRGDIILYKGERYLNVEIKVTHAVDCKKTIELFNLGIPTIEVDLSGLKSNFTPEIVEQKILDGKSVQLITSPKNKEIFAKQILGEWKEIHEVYGLKCVEDCPFSRRRAYFCGKGEGNECHECWSYEPYQHAGGEKLLCLGCLGGIDFGQIEKILHLEKEENHIRYVRLLMKDGNIIERPELGKTRMQNQSYNK